jgi:hypothetical protein
MLTKDILRAALAVVLFAQAAPASALECAREPCRFDGTYTLVPELSDDIDAAIKRATQRMNFFVRPIARLRLRKVNRTHQTLEFHVDSLMLHSAYDHKPAIVSPRDGVMTRWTREDGEEFSVTSSVAGDSVVQTFHAKDGQRENVVTLSEDGSMLTVRITIRSPRLPDPLTYRLVYRRTALVGDE